MKITRVSPVTGKSNTMDIPLTQEDLSRIWRGYELIQDVLPNLSPDQREFLISGCTPEDWAKLYPPEEE